MTRRGRPRLTTSASGRGTRFDILQSAATCFIERGMAASTREIADGAGIRQASLYHYFPNREAILLVLLQATVRPTLDIAADLRARPEPAPARLWALACWDSTQLGGGDLNLGALYLLPEAQLPEYAAFQDDWSAVRAHYDALVAECIQERETASSRSDIVLGLVESVVLIRRRDPAAVPSPEDIADSAVLLATGRPPTATIRRTAHRILGELPPPDSETGIAAYADSAD